jgi:hypothetical protein
VIVRELDLAEAARRRAAFGFFRDRRPELYARIVREVGARGAATGAALGPGGSAGAERAGYRS